MYSRNSISMQKLDHTFITPSKFLGKFFVKIYIWAKSHLLKTYREQWLLVMPDGWLQPVDTYALSYLTYTI